MAFLKSLNGARKLRWVGDITKGHMKHWSQPQVRALHTNNDFFHISEEVREALHSKKPVVALETTIYTHGFPYPDNVALASHLESVVRVNGGVPATVGVLDGTARVGMGADDLIRLAAAAGDPSTLKVSRRDLGYIGGLGISGKKMNGGTTIAGTMVLAHLAGIKVFATGGLGGVHKGGENSLDISADLTELGRTPVAVISSGCKSFLDIPRTLEYLETQGVGVGTFADGRQGKVDYPAFWSRDSGTRSPLTISNEADAAAIIHAQAMLPLSSGLHFANPIPPESAISKAEMDTVIAQAIKDADESGATGSSNTPFILNRIKELTDGRSVKANRALIESNVARGTRVAVQLAQLELHEAGVAGREATQVQARSSVPLPTSGDQPVAADVSDGVRSSASTPLTKEVDVLVAGAVAIDLMCDFAPLEAGTHAQHKSPILHTSNPSIMRQSLGGVGSNVARASHLAGAATRLCSLVGNDLQGIAALRLLQEQGMDTSGIRHEDGQSTAQYAAFNDTDKNLVMAMADMAISERSSKDFATIWKPSLESAKPRWLAIDGNLSSESLQSWIHAGKIQGARVAFEPVSTAKARKLFRPGSGAQSFGVFPDHHVDLASPNNLELQAMFAAAKEHGWLDRQDWWQVIDSFGLPSSGARDRLVALTNSSLVEQGIPQQSLQLLPFIPTILTKLGPQGVLLTQILDAKDERLRGPQAAPYLLSQILDERSTAGGVYMRLFPPSEVVPDEDIISVNGVGDTFLGVLLAGLAQNPDLAIEKIIPYAQQASVMTLKSEESVHPDLKKIASNWRRGGASIP